MLQEDRRDKQQAVPRDARVDRALSKIESAQRLIDGAAQELCSVEGFAEEWRLVCELYQEVKEHWHRVERRRGELRRSSLDELPGEAD